MPRMRCKTAGELREALADYPDDMPVAIYSHLTEDGGSLLTGVYLDVQDPAYPDDLFYYAGDSPFSEYRGAERVTVPLLTINS